MKETATRLARPKIFPTPNSDRLRNHRRWRYSHGEPYTIVISLVDPHPTVFCPLHHPIIFSSSLPPSPAAVTFQIPLPPFLTQVTDFADSYRRTTSGNYRHCHLVVTMRGVICWWVSPVRPPLPLSIPAASTSVLPRFPTSSILPSIPVVSLAFNSGTLPFLSTAISTHPRHRISRLNCVLVSFSVCSIWELFNILYGHCSFWLSPA